MNKVETNWHKIFPNTDKIELFSLGNLAIEDLKKCRRKYPLSKFLTYKGIVYAWRISDLKDLKIETIYAERHPYLFLRIISEILIEQFYSNKEVYIDKRMSLYTITDYRNQLLEGEYSYLKIYRNYHIHFSTLFYNGVQNFGFSITTSISERLNWEKQDFIDNDLEYEDLYFSDKEGYVKTNSTSKYRISNFYGESSKLKKDLDDLSSAKLEYEDITLFIDEFFSRKKLDLIYPNNFNIEKIERPDIGIEPDSDLIISTLESPRNYFYNGITPPESKSSFAMRSKIRYNKPFSYDQFENRDINIGVIYPKIYYKNIANFFKVIQDELVNIYKISKEKFKYTTIEIDDFQLESYQNAMQGIGEVDLAIVLIDEGHEQLKPQNSPYFFCKGEFIKRGINSQEIQIQQVNKFLKDNASGEANYADHTIALNIYAKLGGTAWTIKSEGDKRNELVFGVGATVDDEGQPVLGMTSIFRGDGKYLFGDVISVVNIQDYKKKLENVIYKAIKNNLDNHLLDKKKKVYLIFHLFKKAGKDNEIEALRNAINRFKHLEIDFMFIHAGDGHNYRFYAFDLLKEDKYRMISIHKRGRYLRINKELAFVALKKNSTIYKKIEIDNRSSIIDIDYACKQIYEFSEISHTSFNKQGQPVSINTLN